MRPVPNPAHLAPGDLVVYRPFELLGWAIAARTGYLFSHVEVVEVPGVSTFSSRADRGVVARHGVDTSRMVWTPEGRVGTLFYERAVPPRPPRVWYDRKDSAFTTLRASELDWGYLTAAQVVLMAGTAPALSPVLRETTREIGARVRAAGRLFALDVNYRAKLWSPGSGRVFRDAVASGEYPVLRAARRSAPIRCRGRA